jgi:rhodanese-related sulfurtransferase
MRLAIAHLAAHQAPHSAPHENHGEMKMTMSVKQLLDAARSAVPTISPAQAREMIATDQVMIVDVRDAPEIEKSGKIAGAVHVSRGMLEFRADPESPYHDKAFAKDKTVILYCASGGRSALGGKALKDMGYRQVYNLGAFKDWVESGGLFERADGKAGGTILACIGAGLAGIIGASVVALALLTTIPAAQSMTWDAVNGVPPVKTACRLQLDAE